LSGYFGKSLPESHRAALHIEATRLVWQSLIELLAKKGVSTLAELNEWLKAPIPKAPGRRRYLVERAARLKLSERPGVYRMHAKDGRVLYVGKATSLKSRVNSYFRSQSPKRELLAQVSDIQVVEVETPVEAALLESDEIKRWNPPYNISLREQERTLTYFSRDFLEMSPVASPAHPHGPFRGSHEWVSLGALSQVETPELREEVFPDLTDEKILKDGLALVLGHLKWPGSVEEGSFRDLRSLLQMGRRLWHYG
jgi:DNA polymerase-3 subunit epsilon